MAASYGGFYVSHLRGGLEGLAEGIAIAREAGTALEIHHLNSTSGSRIGEYAAAIAEARAAGVEVTGNVYPYIAGWTYLRSLLPRWVQEGGVDRMLGRLTDDADRERLLAELRAGEAERSRWARTFVSSFREEVDGLSILDLGAARGLPPEEALLDLLLEQEGEGFQISFGNTEPNLTRRSRSPSPTSVRTAARWRSGCAPRWGSRIPARSGPIRGCWRNMFGTRGSCRSKKRSAR